MLKTTTSLYPCHTSNSLFRFEATNKTVEYEQQLIELTLDAKKKTERVEALEKQIENFSNEK